MKAVVVLLALIAAASACAAGRSEIVVGAIYPTRGSQGPGGLDEYRGVQLAADLVNRRGGIGGRRIRIDLIPAETADATPQAMKELVARKVPVVVGSYGSTIAEVAARIAARENVVFWETGAVGMLPPVRNDHTFRVPATGETLGRVAVEFVRDVYLPRKRNAVKPRYGVAYVDDVYGGSVGRGAIERIRADGNPVATFPYEARRTDFSELARRIRAAGVNVLVVGAYLDDGIALRRALVRMRVPLIANIGTSSSYCMHEFGARLGADAVGVFASDKPDAASVPLRALRNGAAHDLRWAQREFAKRFGGEMHSPALAGFAGSLALFRDVLPAARKVSAPEIVSAARRVRVPLGGLPNGSGLEFTGGAAGPSENDRAASVIWEWVAPNKRAVVWPPAFASRPPTHS